MVVLSETPLLVLPVLAFDLDDTLWDTAATLGAAHAAMAAAAPALLEEHRSPDGFVKEMLATMATHPDQKHDFTFLRKTTLLRLLGCERSAEESYTKWFAVRNQPCFFPGAIEALRRLQESGFRLCAISDGNSRPMDIAELSGVFEFAVSAEEAGASKPDPRPFQLAAKRAGVPCSSMIYVGDNYEKDVVGAKATGMRAVWVRALRKQSAEEAVAASVHNLSPVLSDEVKEAFSSVADLEVAAVAELSLDLIADKLLSPASA